MFSHPEGGSNDDGTSRHPVKPLLFLFCGSCIQTKMQEKIAVHKIVNKIINQTFISGMSY